MPTPSSTKASPKAKPAKAPRQPRGLIILYEDQDIIVVDKAPGLLTIGTEREKEKTAYFRLTDYVRRGNPKSRERIFVVHRLDKDTSGILIFARNAETKIKLQENWENVQKTYLAVVKGTPRKHEAIISSHLNENQAQVVRSTRSKDDGKLARTRYKVVHFGKMCSMLELTLLTGRKNQLRVHLSELGHPIIGDKKYGDDEIPARRLALHAVSIKFHHPRTGELLEFKCKVPPIFMILVGKPVSGKKSGEAVEVLDEILLVKVADEIRAVTGPALLKLREKEEARKRAEHEAELERLRTLNLEKAREEANRKKMVNRPFSKKKRPANAKKKTGGATGQNKNKGR